MDTEHKCKTCHNNTVTRTIEDSVNITQILRCNACNTVEIKASAKDTCPKPCGRTGSKKPAELDVTNVFKNLFKK